MRTIWSSCRKSGDDLVVSHSANVDLIPILAHRDPFEGWIQGAATFERRKGDLLFESQVGQRKGRNRLTSQFDGIGDGSGSPECVQSLDSMSAFAAQYSCACLLQ